MKIFLVPLQNPVLRQPQAPWHSPSGAGLPDKCETLGVADYNDQWARFYIANAEAKGFRLVAHRRGRFRLLVTSTLHTYLDADVYYFRCPQPGN